MKTKDELIREVLEYGPFVTEERATKMVERWLALADNSNYPGQFVYHCLHYGKLHSYPHDTLNSALHDAWGGFDSGEEFGLCITKDGEIISGSTMIEEAEECLKHECGWDI